jgi:hypothetical protein
MRNLHMNKFLLAGVTVAYGLTGCGAGGGSQGLNAPQVVNVKTNVLQFAVGTANLYGTTVGLNVVATYRQPKGSQLPGASGTLVNSPTLTIPGTLPAPAGTVGALDCLSTILTGAATSEVGGSSITSSSQAGNTAAVTTFGQSGGVTAVGIEPFNYQGSATGSGCGGAQGGLTPGIPYTFVPYSVPLYDPADVAAGNTDPNSFVPWGGPPAYDVAGTGQSIVGNQAYQNGVSGAEMGIDVFQGVAATVGTYTLGVKVPTTTAGAPTTSATYTLATATTLGNATSPAMTLDGTGGASFAVTMPTGAVEALVQVTDFGPSAATPPAFGCTAAQQSVGTGFTSGGFSYNASQAKPVYYTISDTTAGASTVTLADTAGPEGGAAICPGDEVSVQLIGVDYPIVGMGFPASNGVPAPAIEGANGLANAGDNITISAAVCNQAPAGAGATTPCPDPLPLLKKRSLAAIQTRHHTR